MADQLARRRRRELGFYSFLEGQKLVVRKDAQETLEQHHGFAKTGV
jgi:hypothetical protein